jgi:hypothetical protein
MTDKPASTNQKVTVEVTGGIRRASISIDAVPVPLRETDEGFSGSTTIALEPSTITAVWAVKGGRNASYDFGITINDTTQSIKGALDNEGIKSDEQTWTFHDFGLDK